MARGLAALIVLKSSGEVSSCDFPSKLPLSRRQKPFAGFPAPRTEQGGRMRSPRCWFFGLLIALMLTVVPFYYYRWAYTHSKRLRPVVHGQVYRSGQMTAPGFAEAVDRFHFHTIIN